MAYKRIDMTESVANVIVGLAINWTLLAVVYGEFITATWISATMIGVSWARSYALRRLFRRIADV